MHWLGQEEPTERCKYQDHTGLEFYYAQLDGCVSKLDHQQTRLSASEGFYNFDTDQYNPVRDDVAHPVAAMRV